MSEDTGSTNPLIVDSSDPLPCGYVMGVQGASVTGIPGLKSETWGTLRVSRAESIWGAGGWDRYMSATKEAVEEHGKNDAADQDVDLVLLDRKTVDAKSDTHDWGRDQKQNA